MNVTPHLWRVFKMSRA